MSQLELGLRLAGILMWLTQGLSWVRVALRLTSRNTSQKLPFPMRVFYDSVSPGGGRLLVIGRAEVVCTYDGQPMKDGITYTGTVLEVRWVPGVENG